MRLYVCVCLLDSKCRCVRTSGCSCASVTESNWVATRGGWKARTADSIPFTLLLPWHVPLLHMQCLYALGQFTIIVSFAPRTTLCFQQSSTILYLIIFLLLKLLSDGLTYIYIKKCFKKHTTEHRFVLCFQIWLSNWRLVARLQHTVRRLVEWQEQAAVAATGEKADDWQVYCNQDCWQRKICNRKKIELHGKTV